MEIVKLYLCYMSLHGHYEEFINCEFRVINFFILIFRIVRRKYLFELWVTNLHINIFSILFIMRVFTFLTIKLGNFIKISYWAFKNYKNFNEMNNLNNIELVPEIKIQYLLNICSFYMSFKYKTYIKYMNII